MEAVTITITKEDKNYVDTKISNFSEFVRASIRDHQAVFSKETDIQTALEMELYKITSEYGSKKQLIESKIEKIKYDKENFLKLKNNPDR